MKVMKKTIVINMSSKKVIKKSGVKKRMAGKRKGKKSKSRKSGSNNQLFSGKVLGISVPGAKGVLGNKTIQKVLVGAGAVSVGLSLVQLFNNSTLNKFASKKEVRIGLAAIAGDIPGAVFQFIKEEPRIIQGVTGGGTQGNSQILSREGLA